MNGTGPLLDARAVQRNHERASAGYDAAAVLPAELREQMIERLGWIAFEPDTVLDLGCGTGHAAVALSRRWPKARIVAVDFAPGMLREGAHRRGGFRSGHVARSRAA